MPAVGVGTSRSCSLLKESAAEVGSAAATGDSIKLSSHGIIDVSFGKFNENVSSGHLPSLCQMPSHSEVLGSKSQRDCPGGFTREFSLQSVNPQSRSVQPGIPVARHRAKLEECADLHRHLEGMMMELRITQEQLNGSKSENNDLSMEILRLRDLLNTTTSELQLQQERVDELLRENKQLRCEVRAGQANGVCPGGQMKTLSTRALQALSGTLAGTQGSNITGTVLRPQNFSPDRPRITHGAMAPRLGASASQQQQHLLHADTMNVSGAITAYVCECFRSEVLPHIELLHSLCDSGRLVAVDPPITHAQLSVLQRVVDKTRMTMGTNESNHAKKCSKLLNTFRGSLTFSSSSSLSQSSWVNCVNFMSFRSESWYTTIGLVLQMIHSLQCVRCVELFAVSDDSVMRRLAETLLMELHVKALSLPEMSLTDEGLAVLFALMVRRERLELKDTTTTGLATWNLPSECCVGQSMDDVSLGSSVAAATTAPASLADADSIVESETSLLEVRCLDLSRCTIWHPTTLFHAFRGPTVEVLILTRCSALCDVNVRDILDGCPQLHTLDLSGNDGLTTACVKYLSCHERLKVLRLENCPSIRRLELANVEVLFSSLVHVATLRAPELRCLPVPLTHSNVLFDFYAPKLLEITLKGIVIHRDTLGVFIPNASGNGDERSLSPCPSTGSGFALSDQTSEKRESCDVAQLHSVGFIDCTIVSSSELESFVKHQSQMLRFSLHGCKGVVDAHLAQIPTTLLELDVGTVAQLTGKSIDAIATRLSHLVKLNLKNTGTAIQNSQLHRLRGLVNLEELNLLGMPQLHPDVVAAVVEALPKLRVLYHEAALVETDPASTTTAARRVARTDEETTMRRDINNCAVELLQLRDETSLALWMEKQLPKPVNLLPSRPTTKHTRDAGTALANTTHYYGLAHRTLSRHGTSSMSFVDEQLSSVAKTGDVSQQKSKADVLTFSSMNFEPMGGSASTATGAAAAADVVAVVDNDDNNNNSNNDCGDDDDNDALKQDNLKDSHMLVAAMDEKSRLAIERAPLGPWDDADIVAEHRHQSGC